ncbi:MAG: hypothetical protein AB7P01_09110 [Bacteroidia bacterium]
MKNHLNTLLLIILFVSITSLSQAQSDIKSKFKFVFQKTNNEGSNIFLLIEDELIFIEASEFPSVYDEPISNKNTLASSRAWYIGAGCIYWANYSNNIIEIKKQLLEEGSELPIKTIKTISISSIGSDLGVQLKSMFSQTPTSASAEKFAGRWKCQLVGGSSFFHYEFKKTGETSFSGQWFGDNTFSKGGQILTWYLVNGKLQHDETVITVTNDNELLQKQGDNIYKLYRLNSK